MVLSGPGQTQNICSAAKAHTASLSEKGHSSGVPQQGERGSGAEADGPPARAESGKLLPDAEELRDGPKTCWFSWTVPKPQSDFFK